MAFPASCKRKKIAMEKFISMSACKLCVMHGGRLFRIASFPFLPFHQQFCAISETSATKTHIQIKSADRFYNNTIPEVTTNQTMHHFSALTGII
jgi:preprotein translocase subunit Sec63